MQTKVITKKVPKIGVEHTEGIGRLYPYLYAIGDLAQGIFHKSFQMCIYQKNFLRSFLVQKNFHKDFHVHQPRKFLEKHPS
jgi:hypothetical protein